MDTWKIQRHTPLLIFERSWPYQFTKECLCENLTQTRTARSIVAKWPSGSGFGLILFFFFRSTFSTLVLVVTVIATVLSFVKPTANAYALNCFGLHLVYVLAVEMRRYWNSAISIAFAAVLRFYGVKISMLQLHWREGAASSQDLCASVGARYLLLAQRSVWLQHLAEVELLLLTRLLVTPPVFSFWPMLRHCSPRR